MSFSASSFFSFIDALEYFFTSPYLLGLAMYSLLCLLCVFWIIATGVKIKKESWDGAFFIVLCAMILLLTLSYLIPAAVNDKSGIVVIFRFILFTCIPAAHFIHVNKQVFYRKISFAIEVFLFSMPFLAVGMFFTAAWLGSGTVMYWINSLYVKIGIGLWYICLALAGTIYCINIYFQTPKHMWNSNRYLLTSILCLLLFAVFSLLFRFEMHFVLEIITLLFMLGNLYMALSRQLSANTIATSRDFVISSLTTNILVLSRNMQILDWNKKNKRSGTPLPSPKYMEDFSNYKKRLAQEDDQNPDKQIGDVVTILKDRAESHYLISINEIKEGGRIFGYLAEISDVTQIYSALRQLDYMAMLDQLTGLFSRNAYMEKVKTILKSENMPLLVIVGDVNGLKTVNDTHGHIAGDRLLSAVASIVKSVKPENAFAARIGGDEFTLLIPKSGTQDALPFIEGVNNACKEVNDPYYGTPSISWGYAAMEDISEDYNNVFQKADSMMYETKRKHFVFRSSGLLIDGNSDSAMEMREKPEEKENNWQNKDSGGYI